MVVLSHITQNKLNSLSEITLKSSSFCLTSTIPDLFLFILKKVAFISCFTNLFICLLSSYVFPSLDYIFHSAPFCFASLLYCQFLKSAITRLEILHFSNIDCLVMNIFFTSHIFFLNSRVLLKFLKKLCYSHITVLTSGCCMYFQNWQNSVLCTWCLLTTTYFINIYIFSQLFGLKYMPWV